MHILAFDVLCRTNTESLNTGLSTELRLVERLESSLMDHPDFVFSIR